MARMKIVSKILGNISDLQKFIVNSIRDQLNAKLFTKVGDAQSRIKDIIINNIKQQPEYSSLKSGELRGAFGLANTLDVDVILSELENMSVEIKKPVASSKGIDARISISMVRNGFADLLSSPAASFVSENGYQVNWLEWLLLRGNDSVVIGYRYSPKASLRSRTGEGIMVKGNSSVFRVPPSYAGTISNNWITRGIDQSLPEIESYMNKMVEIAL
jgi:hypothetical protein